MMRKETKGVLYMFVEAILWGFFPIVVNQGTQHIPPLTFAAIITLLAALTTFFYAAFTGVLKELKNTKSYFSLFMVTLCIVIIPYTLFFLGSSKTSGINSSFLLLSEIIFTLVFTPFIGEKTTMKKLVGALGVFIGAGCILFNGAFQLKSGDLLIILSTTTYPIGNFFAKKAFNFVSPAIILFVRFLLGGSFILLFALVSESQTNLFETILNNWMIIFFAGVIILGTSKILFYEGLKRMDISKAISIAMTFPFFSFVFLISFFDEIPTFFQSIGILIMAIGVYFSLTRESTNPKLTKYSS